MGLEKFGEKLIEFSKKTGEKKALGRLEKFMDKELLIHDSPEDQQLAKDVRQKIEKYYKLKPAELLDSYRTKYQSLTIPKLMWVAVCMHVFNDDRKKVLRLIGNGISRQKVYTCIKYFESLKEAFAHEKEIKDSYQEIINTYE